ncbi:short-chain dehydrogenase reductase family [Fusarium sporotrichioides]|uniref:Short-chain dehydrogenase reductase family n=1 Tax=Fusarium sporotrichioides TaxID=5514 RepID=A0A395S770_FUSSP|nr:short-chain dehydrogenase reductase family [Fusarium sporotrichioides]
MTVCSQPKRKGAGLLRRLASPFLPSTEYPSKYLDLTGKTALVTGTTSGLGLEACRQLLSHGVSQLIMSARTEIKGETVAEELRFQYPHADIQVWILEMESYDSVIAFTERAAVDLDRLDMVILNAGTFDPDASVSNYTGHEKMFQVNYLSTALLARLFVPVLKVVPPEREPSRLTVVTDGHYNPSRSVGATYALVGRTLEKGAATYVDAVAVKGRESHGETISNCRSQYRIMDCCKPVEWQDFEESFWEMTEREFRSLFTGSQTLGAKIYNAIMTEQWLRRSQA